MAEYRPDWYPDPSGRFDLRYHNGAAWTADVSTNGRRFVDQLPPTSAVERPLRSGAPPARPDTAGRNGFAIAALVLGIGALMTSWVPYVFVIGAVAAVLAITFGVIALRRAGDNGPGRGPAIAGLITGGLAVPAAVGGFFFTLAVDDALDAYDNPGPHEAVIDSCTSNAGTWTTTGTIENQDDERRDYAIDVAFVREGTDNVQRGATVEVDGVEPGEVREFRLERRSEQDGLDCVIVDVHGPLPFGFDLD